MLWCSTYCTRRFQRAKWPQRHGSCFWGGWYQLGQHWPSTHFSGGPDALLTFHWRTPHRSTEHLGVPGRHYWEETGLHCGAMWSPSCSFMVPGCGRLWSRTIKWWSQGSKSTTYLETTEHLQKEDGQKGSLRQILNYPRHPTQRTSTNPYWGLERWHRAASWHLHYRHSDTVDQILPKGTSQTEKALHHRGDVDSSRTKEQPLQTSPIYTESATQGMAAGLLLHMENWHWDWSGICSAFVLLQSEAQCKLLQLQ